MTFVTTDSIEARERQGIAHRSAGARWLVALLRGRRRAAAAVPLASGTACAVSLVVCPVAAWAQAPVADGAARIDVRGVAVDTRERSEVALAKARHGDAPSQLQLVHGVALRQSQWGGPAATPAPQRADDLLPQHVLRQSE